MTKSAGRPPLVYHGAMRIAAILLLLAACSSGGGGSFVDGSQVGGPFSFAGGGFTTDNPQFGRYPSTRRCW